MNKIHVPNVFEGELHLKSNLLFQEFLWNAELRIFWYESLCINIDSKFQLFFKKEGLSVQCKLLWSYNIILVCRFPAGFARKYPSMLLWINLSPADWPWLNYNFLFFFLFSLSTEQAKFRHRTSWLFTMLGNRSEWFLFKSLILNGHNLSSKWWCTSNVRKRLGKTLLEYIVLI